MGFIKCENMECEPPFGGKENCEFYNNGNCIAPTKKELCEAIEKFENMNKK